MTGLFHLLHKGCALPYTKSPLLVVLKGGGESLSHLPWDHYFVLNVEGKEFNLLSIHPRSCKMLSIVLRYNILTCCEFWKLVLVIVSH